MLSRFILFMFPNKTLFNIPAMFVLLPLLLICWCVGVSQEEVILNEEIGLDVSLVKNSSQIRNYHKGLNKLGSILHQNHATTATTTRATRIIKNQVVTRPYYNIHTHMFFYGNKDLLTEKRIKDKKVAVGIKNYTCGDNSGCNSHGSETVLEKQEKHNTEPSVPLSENKDLLQKDDVHIKILDTDARRRRDRGPFQRWWPRRNRRRYWSPSRRDRKWWKRNRQRWRQRQRPNMTTPLPTSTALVDTETGDRRVIITRPGHRERPSQNQTGGSTSISQRKGYAYWNVPPFVMKMQRKLQYKIRQMSNMVYNGLSDTLYNITRRSKYIVNKHSALKEDASGLISDTHDDIEDIVELNNNIYDLVLSISAFHRRLYERLYEQGPSPTPGAIPNITAFVKRDHSGLNREALILLRMMKHMRNKFFQLNHTYAKHINYYYDKLDRIRDVISSQRIRIGDLMDMAMYVNNQMSNLTKLQVPSVLRQIYDERHKLITDNYQSRHQLHVTEQVHQDVTTFQKSCRLRLQELTQLNYTLLKKLPMPTTTPLTFKEKRKLQKLVNRVKGHTENILKTAAEIDSLLPPAITSAKELILKLSMESQSDSYKVWALGNILKQWGKIASAVHGNAGRRKWMKTRRQRIRRMRERMTKSKSLISKRNRRAADVVEEDIDKIYEEIIHILTQIIKRLDDMWMKLFEVSSGNIGEHLQSIVSASLSQSKKHLKISRNLVNDVQDIKSSLDEVKAKEKKLENNVNESADTVNIYQELVSNATEMRRLINETELKINASQVKCLAVQKLADLVLADQDELERLLEVKKKEKENERKEKKEKERKEKEGNEKDKNNKEVRKKKKKKLKDKSNDNVMDLNRRGENEEKRRKDKKKDNDGKVEGDASKKELEENERTKSELKALIEKYLRLQEEEEEEKKRKNEEKGKKKKVTNVEREEVEDKKERKSKKRRRKKSKRDDLGKKNNQKNESIDEQRNKQEKNKTGKRRKEDDGSLSKHGKEVEGKRSKKKKLTENRKNEDDVNQVTDKNTENETRKKLSEIDMNSVLEIRKNLEDVLKKLNQKLEGSKNWTQRQRRKRRRRKQIELASKKRDKKRSRNKGVMGDKEMINDKETSEELNEKAESGNENEDKRRKVKNEVEDPKADADEEVKENFEEGWKNNHTERKSRKKDINEEMNENRVKKNKGKEKNNEPKKKWKKHINDGNTVIKEDKNIKERGRGDEVKEKKEKKVRDDENDEKKDIQKNLNEREKSNKGRRKKDKNEKNGFEEDTESNVKRRKKKRKVITKEEENKKRDKIKVKKNRMSLEEGKEETDEDKEHQKKDLQEEKMNKVKTRKRKDGTKKENDITDSVENNSKEREKNDLEKEEKGEDSDRKKRKKHRKNKEEEREKERKKKRKEVTKKSLYIKNQKDVNETEEEIEGKENRRKDKGEMDLDNKKEMLKKRKKSNNSTMTSLVEEGKVRRNGGRSRKFQRKRKNILNEKLRSSPIFIQDEEQSFAKEMKNKTKQIEEDVKKSKMAVESIVKQLKEFFPDPCTSISNNINQLRLNVSQIRQKIQLARTIVSSMKIPVSLNGKQHLEMMLNQKTESREIQTSVEICIKPRTTNSVILSLQANNSISYSLALVDSKPLLTILDVNGEMLKKLEPDTKLIKNNWYQFLIHRNGQNFSLSVNPTGSKYERITVQKFIPDFSPEQIPLSLVSLGGYPENFPINNSEKLKGCIAYLNVNGHSTRIFSPLKSGLYPSVCKTDSESFTNTSMVFEGNGFALFESDVLKKPFTLVRLNFKTFQKNALLMSIKSNSKMLLIVTLIEGNIHVERRGKTSNIAKQSQGTEFSNGQLHTVQVMVIKNQLEIKTSSEKVEFEDKDASGDEMIFDEGISLGGLASNVRNESKYRSFTGCLSNVSIDNTPLNLLYLKDGRHVYQGDCKGNIWISCARFTESSVPVTLTKYDHVRSISLMVSAQAQGVALFFERKDKFSIKLQLTTMSLEVFNHENDENEIILKKNESRFWHLLHIEDQQGNIHITLDGEQSVDMAYKKNTGWFYSNADDFSMFVTVGGLPKEHKHFKKLNTFIGSISTLFIQHLLINLNREFGSSYNLSVCAKPTVELFTKKLNCTNSVGG